MRPIQRDPHPPAELARNAAELTVEWLRRLECAAPGKPAKWTWGKQEYGKTVRDHILPELKRQTDGHCSYCDLYPVAAGSPETVDHFRPKEAHGWPQLAYEWGNLFFACFACQIEKGSKFDEDAIPPDMADYRWQDYFHFDAITGELRAKGAPGELRYRRALATIKLLGLNECGRPRARRNAHRSWCREGKPPVRWRTYRFCLIPPPAA